MDYPAEEMSIVRVALGFFGIGPLIVTYSEGLHTFCRFDPRDSEYQKVGGHCMQVLCCSGWQTC